MDEIAVVWHNHTNGFFYAGVAMARNTEQNGTHEISTAKKDSSTGAAWMPRRRHAAILLTCVLLCLSASCSKSDRKTTGILDDTPPSLQRISERAEGIIVAVPAQDWPRVYAYIKDIDDTWRDYKNPTVTASSEPRRYPTGLLYGDLDAALTGLKYGAAAKDVPGTIKAAGEVSSAAAVLIGYYNPERPSGLHRLALHENRIMVEATDGDLAAASRHLQDVRVAWNRVRPAVLIRTQDVVVRGFDQLIDEQNEAIQARNLPRLASGARTALQMINDMQQLNY